MVLLVLPIALSYTEVDYSLDNTTWNHLINTNNNTIIIEGLNDGINEDTTYYFRLRNVYDTGTSDWVYGSKDTKTSGEIPMNDLALYLPVVLALLGVAFMFFFFAFKLDEEHFILKIFLIIIGLVTLILVPSSFTSGFSGVQANFLRITLWVFRIFIIYLAVYVIYNWAKRSETFVKWLGKQKE